MMRAYLDTYQTPRARIRIHDKGPTFKMDGILRAIVGAHTALVTEVDTVIARSGETGLNAQQ
jgi:hypothetical protein